MPTFSRSLEKALHRALALANERRHEYATLEHLLPLPFARAAAGEQAHVERLEGGYRYGALSMHAFVFA